MKGSVRQRSKGSWQIRYEGYPDAKGKRKFHQETIRGTKKEAERVMRERISSIDNGSYIPKNNETLGHFLNNWVDTYAATNVSVRTLHGYQGYINRYLSSTISDVGLQDLNARHIQKVYADMLQRGLSNTTVVQLHRILRQALGYGVKTGVLSRNVADATSPPRIQRKTINMWDVDLINDFLRQAGESRYRDIYHFTILTGLRRSEICGLKWDNVDLTTGRLSIVSTLQRISGMGLVEGVPKTPRSRRSIALGADSIALLHAVRGKQLEFQLQAGVLWQQHGYVFTQETGMPIAPDMISKEFCSIVRKSGLPHMTFHGLRHAHATLALKAGVHLKVVSERLGHGSISITADIYSHVLPNLQHEAAEAVEQLLHPFAGR